MKKTQVDNKISKKPEKCEICKRSFKKIPFGYNLKTSWGSIDICEPCSEDTYTAIVADLVGGFFSLRRDVEDIKLFFNKLANSKTWKHILNEAGLIQPHISYPKNIQRELNELSKKYNVYIKKWGKNVRPLRKKLQKMDSEQQRFRVEINKEKARLLRKASAELHKQHNL